MDRWAHSVLGTGRVGCIPELVGVVTGDLSRLCPGGAGRIVIWDLLFNFFFFFLQGSYSAAQADLELFLLCPSECWHGKHVALHCLHLRLLFLLLVF